MRPTIFFKFILFSLLILSFDYQVVGQAPESMNYQAVIRDGSGNIVASQAVGLRIKILQGSASGSPVYVETFAPTTNAYGSIAIQIGTGTVVSGTFNSIDWGANSHFVETAVDIDGTANGTSYVVISTTQLMSVPYALYAKTAGNAVWSELSGNAYRTSGNIGIGTANPEWNLDVKSSSTTEGGIMQLSNSNEDHLFRIFTGSNSDPNPFLLWKTGDPLRFSSASGIDNDGSWQEHMRINSNGNVGIGTSSPTSLLQISDGNAQGPTFKIDGLSPSILLQDNSGVSNTVDNFEIRNNLGSLNFSYGDNSDANDDGFLSNTALSISNNGTTRVTNLAGTGDRMVVADADGDLSTQAIPSGGSSMPSGNNNGDMMYWDGSAWQTIAVGSNGAVLQIINGVPSWVSSPDITGPTITLNGDVNMNVVVGGTFTDPGATTDEGTLTTSGTVDVTTAGTYTITYNSTDATGNTATATRTVAVYQSQFNYTGSAQTFTVPAGVTSISVDAYGASSTVICATYQVNGAGGEGLGGRVQSTLSVTPGQTLNIYVGGSSNYCGQSGWPSAYVGWNGGAGGYRRGGGGATDIRIGGTSLADRVIVSGGGGSGSWWADGGDGGGLVGGDGNVGSPGNTSTNTIGHGGTQSAGGGGGYWYGGSSSTNQGTLGNGALGASVSGNGGNGHGGGGYYGGGGGVYDGGGGGGSSYTHPTLCSSVVHTQGGNPNLGHGQLIITVP
jgi:hypothetical protein